MTVPQNRLIFWVGLVGLPVALAGAATPAAWLPGVLVCAIFLALVGGDALHSRKRLNDVRVQLPESVNLTKDCEGTFDVVIESANPLQRLTVALAFPEGVVARHEQLIVANNTPRVAQDEEISSRIPWLCTGVKRGKFVIDTAYLETPSALGFWVHRSSSPVQTELRVYPNMLRERKRLAALFLNRGSVGVHAQRQIGKGHELERLREYMPGDIYEDISWKSTAKRSIPITKVYQVEQTQEVYVVIDASRLSGREVGTGLPGASRTETQLERFITTAMVLGLVAERQGDLFGVMAFDEKIRAFVRARNGKQHYAVCRDALYRLEPKPVNPDFGELFSFIRLRLRRRALLIVLTNLDDPLLAEQFMGNLNVVVRHHLLLVNMLQAPGVGPLFTEPGVQDSDAIYRRLTGHLQWQGLRELEGTLRRRGARMALLDHEAMAAQVVSQYINVKQRQIL